MLLTQGSRLVFIISEIYSHVNVTHGTTADLQELVFIIKKIFLKHHYQIYIFCFYIRKQMSMLPEAVEIFGSTEQAEENAIPTHKAVCQQKKETTIIVKTQHTV